MQECNYANRAGSWGPSATAYIDRNGTNVRAIDPTKYAAWSQGDVAYPNTKLPTIAAAGVVLGGGVWPADRRPRARASSAWSGSCSTPTRTWRPSSTTTFSARPSTAR